MRPVVPTVSRPNGARLKGDLSRLDRETQMLLATVDSLSEAEFRAPTRCEGWSRAHIVTHLARNADALGRLATWAVTGVETPAYTSGQARDAAIRDGAGRGPDVLRADLRDSCDRLRSALDRLSTGVVVDEMPLGPGTTGAYDLPVRRTTEVVLHHADLDTVWGLDEADPEAAFDALEDCLRRLELGGGAPDVVIATHEGDEWTLGSGTAAPTAVVGDRAAVAMWLARGDTQGLRLRDESAGTHALPDLPSLG